MNEDGPKAVRITMVSVNNPFGSCESIMPHIIELNKKQSTTGSAYLH